MADQSSKQGRKSVRISNTTDYAASAANPPNQSLFHRSTEHRYRTQREHEFRDIERQFAAALAGIHQEMYNEYQALAQQARQIAEQEKASAYRQYEQYYSQVTNKNVPKLKALLQTELASVDARIASMARQHATEISTRFDERIKDARESLDEYMARANAKWNQQIEEHYRQKQRRIEEYNAIEYQESATLATILQQHADKLNQFLSSQEPFTEADIHRIISSHQQEIQHVKDHFQRLKEPYLRQSGGLRRKMRSTRRNKKSRRNKRY
jgi:hypothetical protein